MKNIRTIAPCIIAGREVRAGLCLSLPTAEADALIEDNLAQPWAAPDRAPEPSPYRTAADASAAVAAALAAEPTE